MFSRNLIPIWFGIIILSGLFLMGQDAWPPLPAPCQDADGDHVGLFGSASCPFPDMIDCDDNNRFINPNVEEMAELCSNEWDDDCDGLYNYDDPDCGVTGMVPDTGITNCYDDTSGVTCPADEDPVLPFYGQDAQYETNPMGYTDNGDGTVTDHVTVLRWQQCTAGTENDGDYDCDDGLSTTYSWSQAEEYCDNLIFATFDDWRLPQINELQSIIDYGEDKPTFSPSYFPNTPYQYYWSITEVSGDTTSAWRIFTQDGYQFTANKAQSSVVRCVRRVSDTKTSLDFTADSLNGIIEDNLTGLVWQMDDSATTTWEQALDYCENLTLATFTNWRLPNIKELVSIADYWTAPDPLGCRAIYDVGFSCTSGVELYMSSSTRSDPHPDQVWELRASNGQTDRIMSKIVAIENDVYVRCVRSPEDL